MSSREYETNRILNQTIVFGEQFYYIILWKTKRKLDKLNILLVNTMYHLRGGGAPIYGIKLAELLKNRGHNPIPFSMKSPYNLESPYEKYFVDFIDFRRELSQKSFRNGIKVLGRTFYFKQARKNIEKLLDEHNIDIVHLNNFLHHISLSIIEPIRRRNIPIVWSLHDHILVCPNTNLYNDNTQSPCADCTSNFKRFILPVIRRCKKSSFGASLLASLEAMFISLHHPSKIPKVFISPSEFLKEQHRRMGFDVSNFKIVPNFVEVDEFEPHYEPGDYALYFGRLSPEKGLDYLIEASAMAKIPLVIAGTGPDENKLKKLAEKLSADVKFVGFVQGDSLKRTIYNSRIVVLPSICYENAPLMVLESFAAGKPVVATNIGGIPELVGDDVGFLVEPGNSENLADAISNIWGDKNKITDLGRRARMLVMQKYFPEKHIETIMSIYNSIV